MDLDKKSIDRKNNTLREMLLKADNAGDIESIDFEKKLSKTNYFVKDKWYAVTLNPCDSHQYFTKTDRRHKFINYVNEKLLHYSKLQIDYYFTVELSEPHVGKFNNNAGPRLHLHGCIKFNSNKGLTIWLLNYYHILLQDCLVDIDKINHPSIWIEYIHKQQEITNFPNLTNLALDEPSADPLVSHLQEKMRGAMQA